MKKLMKLLLLTAVGIFSAGMSSHSVRAEEVQQIVSLNEEEEVKGPVTVISIEDIEFQSQEEAWAYLSEHYGLKITRSDNKYMVPECTVSISGSTLKVSYSTVSGLGIANKIGVKNLYVQYTVDGSGLFGNYSMREYVAENTNSISFAGGYDYVNLQKGLYYRAKQTHYLIVDGIEYQYNMVSEMIQYY